MTISNIIYNNLINLLNRLTLNDASMVSYLATKVPIEQDSLYTLSEGLEGQINEIVATRDMGAIHVDFSTVIQLLDTFLKDFPDLPNNRILEIKFIILLIIKLSETDEDHLIDLNTNIDVTIFDLVKVKNIVSENFYYYDTVNLENSVILFTLNDFTKLEQTFSSNHFPQVLILQLLSKIGVLANVLKRDTYYCLIRFSIRTKALTIQSCVQLHLLKAGKSYHPAFEYPFTPKVNESRIVKSGEPYQQFADSLIILSEYNSQKDILDKFLRLYHVIENFMYKSPIVSIERDSSKLSFSIRDFQRIYDKIKKGELEMLSRLFKTIFSIEYSPARAAIPAVAPTPAVPAVPATAITPRIPRIPARPGIPGVPAVPAIDFLTFTKSKLESLYPNGKTKTEKFNNFLLLLNIIPKLPTNEDNLPQLPISEFHSFFAKLVYAIRCSLVHNRETEFHLTHESLLKHPTLGKAPLLIIKDYLIPCLEEIIFNLIINKNNIVWYEKNSLKLWSK